MWYNMLQGLGEQVEVFRATLGTLTGLESGGGEKGEACGELMLSN
jgi:hypothetical protein